MKSENGIDSPAHIASAILDHVELYRLTIIPAVERLFFSSERYSEGEGRRRAKELLSALVQKGKLVLRPFPKSKDTSQGESYYVLPETKSVKEPSDSQTIDFDLQALWFSTLSEHRYHRLTLTEIRRLLPHPPHHHVRHVVGDCGDGPWMARLYPSKVDIKETLVRLKHFIREARTKHELGPWIESGEYGFCVLVDNYKKVEAVGEAVMSKRQRGGALAHQARIQVAFAPTAGNVSQAISEL